MAEWITLAFVVNVVCLINAKRSLDRSERSLERARDARARALADRG